MASQIHIIRHAESVHNVSKDFSQLDPSLTAVGFAQAAKLNHSFPYSQRVAVIVTSPLRRAIQTALTAFPSTLDQRYYDPSSGHGVENGARLVLDPLLQERSALNCDTGSERAELQAVFPRLDLEGLGSDWPSKKGIFSVDDETVHERARRVRRGLAELTEQLSRGEKRDVVVVTHGVFMKFLTGEPEIDLPKAGWKSYAAQRGVDQEVKFVPIDAII